MKAAPTAGKKVEMKKFLATLAIAGAFLVIAAGPALACEQPPPPPVPVCQDATHVQITAQGMVEIDATHNFCQGRYFDIYTNHGITPPAFYTFGTHHVITLWVPAGADIQWFIRGRDRYVTVVSGATVYAQEYL